MQNKLLILLNERLEITNLRDRIVRDNKTQTHKSVATLGIRLKAINAKIANFGKRHSIVLLDCTYLKNSNGEKVSVSIYYTDISAEEAIDYFKMNCQAKIIEISAMNIPVGRPLKKVFT